MDTTEKRARELLVDAYRSAGHVQMAHEANHLSGGLTNLRERAALNAIIAALTSPARYVTEMGEAAEDYHKSFKYAKPLPAQWRWHEVWKRMKAAQESAR